MRRRLSLTVLTAALAVGLTACVETPTTPATDWSTCPAAGAGQVQVAVVVANAAPPTQVVCVVVADGATGLTALNARAARIGAPAPRVESSMVCGIDGTPAAPECSPAVDGGYRFWNYWIGGGASWASAEEGAGTRTLHQGDVDGWVYGTWDFVTTFPQPPVHPSSFAALTN